MLGIFNSRKSKAMTTVEELEGWKAAIETDINDGRYDVNILKKDISMLRTFSYELVQACDGEPGCVEIKARASSVHRASIEYGQKVTGIKPGEPAKK